MSLNDPRWGNKNQGGGDRGGNQGPPDLEEVWRDVNRRLSNLFGRQGNGDRGGDGGGGGSPSPRQLGGGIGLIAGVVAALWLASGFYIVDASQRGIVLRFGKFVESTEPGLRWRMPYPLETHEIVNLTGVRTVEIGYRGSERNKVLNESLMLTDDENIVNIQFAVQYVLKDPKDYLFKNREPDANVVQAAESAVREIVGKSKMDFVLYEGREQIATAAAKLMQDILDRYEAGITISKVTMQNAQPPEQVQAAFDDAVKAGQDRERQKNEGQAYFNDVVPKAKGAASRLFEEASGYQSRVIANAEGDAARFKSIVAEYAKAPEVTRQRMYLDTMQQVFANTTKVMVDAKGNGNLLYLPLDKLTQATSQAQGLTPQTSDVSMPARAAAPNPASEPVGAPKADVPVPADYRSREAMRSRERGER
ncbi:FtsH protease activity modulator HflK [Niveibacterium sp. 24ML]|uniref:FtsH protease activity modulator HflK n=1 Tax=Niveibacterium sp. 24ML TaxID=2985512 RepID=UPI0022715010|nr:FtsH protease activity modulator HflK [Niveibacterium sp. 24ML]MCX9155100.1 FtsH protease activity modulator HflK [Niveibacterium sp. 24ML]